MKKKEENLENSMGPINCLVTNILQSIFFHFWVNYPFNLHELLNC